MEKEKISIEVAEKEWRQFLTDNDAQSLIPNEDQKSGDEKDREEYSNKKVGFDRMTRAISQGKVVIEEGIITQFLQYPIKTNLGEVVLGKLNYDQRISVKDREAILKGTNNKDSGDLLLAQRKLCAKLTGVDMALLGRVDLADAKVLDNIVSVFFM